MTALLSEKELEHKADNATALFSVDPSDTFYWREILNHAKDEGFSSDVREWQRMPGEEKENAIIGLYEKLLTSYDEGILSIDTVVVKDVLLSTGGPASGIEFRLIDSRLGNIHLFQTTSGKGCLSILGLNTSRKNPFY